jgi:ornithine cyclodeaminase
MRHVTDAMVDDLISAEDAQQTVLEAFVSFGTHRAAMQERIRTEAGGVKLSTLGAVIPDQGVAGAKVYTTIGGRFAFVILLFSTEDGRPLASFDAGAITRLRTAACSVVAARHLAPPDARRMALYGAGAQGQAHAMQIAAAFPLELISLFSPRSATEVAAGLSKRCGVPVKLCSANEALDGADIIVTASRATTPLFAGDDLPAGCFVAAIGSSLPYTRELDDRALARAAMVVVEWRTQALREAGDLVLAGPGVLSSEKIVELAELVTGKVPGRRNATDIAIYKSVGVGLEDIALAGLAWRRLTAR